VRLTDRVLVGLRRGVDTTDSVCSRVGASRTTGAERRGGLRLQLTGVERAVVVGVDEGLDLRLAGEVEKTPNVN